MQGGGCLVAKFGEGGRGGGQFHTKFVVGGEHFLAPSSLK